MSNSIEETSWWSVPQEKITALLQVDPKQGLSDVQVIEYRAKFGANVFAKNIPKSLLSLLFEGIQEPMMLLLLAVAVLSLFFGKMSEAIVMIFVVIVYISVELVNKFRTDRIMVKLKSLVSPTTKVIRNGNATDVKTDDIVVGDILILSEGVFVVADARLLNSHSLVVNESSLTGEALPVEKNADTQVDHTATLAERRNCLFSGTLIVSGEGMAIVVAVGEKSEFGKIAQKVQETQKEKTVLQESMTNLAKILALFALLVSALIPMIGFFRGLDFQEMVLTWLSLTFLMIPGQPPIIIAMALALAAFVLAKKQVIVKRLRGVEIIGQVTSVVSDKTGTITESTMILEMFYTINGPTQKLPEDMQEKIVLGIPDYCSNPTDTAVFKALDLKLKKFKQIGFTGFSDKRPWRDLIYKKNETIVHVVTGSPEILITKSVLSPDQKRMLNDVVRQQTSLGKRVIAYACIENQCQQLDDLENLSFIAIAIIGDPVRKGVADAIALLEQAGVNTFIVTGDHKATAKAIALKIGIFGEVITGDELDKMDDKELFLILGQSNIFARMDPLQKLRLVKLLQQKGEIVAVIGDGVNDAPALKAAQVGIAMGQIGTDLAKEVSDLILTDDNYVHIPDAIAIGRGALDNFRKGITYYLSAKCVLLIVFLLPLFLGISFPFAPIQIILIELLMDLASSTIFVTEPVEPDSMKKPAQKIKKFFAKPLIIKILHKSVALAIGIVFIYLRAYQVYGLTVAQTAAFVAWLLGHICLALNLKQEKLPLITQGFFSNYFGVFWLLAMMAFSCIVTFVAPIYPYLKTTWLPMSLWIELIVIVCATTFWIEIVKIIKLKKRIECFAEH